MILVFLRHGVADPKGPGADDRTRHLTREGRQEVRQVARGLATMDLEFTACLTSPLLRARETAEEAGEILGIEEILVTEGLLPAANWDDLRAALGKFPADTALLLVGHEPSLSRLIAAAAGGPAARLDLKKAGVARVDLESLQGPGELKWLLKPGQAARLKGG